MRGTAAFGASSNPAWVPTEQAVSRSRLLAAMRRWGFTRVEDLHAASIDKADWFWRAVVDDLGIEFTEPFGDVLDDGAGKPLPRWFVGGKVNAATLCAHRHATSEIAHKPAVVYEGDSGQHRALTYAQLDAEVRRIAANLAKMGVGRGDRVVLFAPVVPEAVVSFLACAMLGAIVVPAFSGFGADALATRLVDSEATLLITADGTTRRGKVVPLKAVADEALASAPDVRNVLVLRHLDAEVEMRPGRDLYWDELDPTPPPVDTAPTESNDPLTIIYTSGTTGRPKGIVHSHAGFAVKAAVDFAYGLDIQSDDVIAWIADMGWMLGPLLIMGGLQLGATVVFTEGLPNHPTPDRVWDIAARNGVTVQGIAPTAARLLMTSGEAAAPTLPQLRAFAATGEAWDEPTWHWLFDDIGRRRRPIMNYTGGTETGGGILVSYPFLPADAAAFNGPLPGMEVAVLDDDGRCVTDQVGELALLNTWPGMTHAFWHDEDRYLDTYWTKWPGIWRHGDLARVNADGSWQLLGRSDDTIKIAGRRVGPGEIETALLRDSRIAEAAVVGVPDAVRGQRVVAFVVVKDKSVPFDELVTTAVSNVGRSFAPTVHVVSAIPKTKNGKIMRRAIRDQHLGEPPGDLSALDPATPLDDIPTLAHQGEHNDGH